MIREATLSPAMQGESVDGWLGRPWVEIVGDTGGDKVKRMVDDARASGISAFRQINQRFPSGLEIPMEFTTVLLGGRAGMLAIGKNLQAVAELQSRLIAAQQTMERDYWKLREIETRYRLVFDASDEAVVILSPANLRIVEANRSAVEALKLVAVFAMKIWPAVSFFMTWRRRIVKRFAKCSTAYANAARRSVFLFTLDRMQNRGCCADRS